MPKRWTGRVLDCMSKQVINLTTVLLALPRWLRLENFLHLKCKVTMWFQISKPLSSTYTPEQFVDLLNLISSWYSVSIVSGLELFKLASGLRVNTDYCTVVRDVVRVAATCGFSRKSLIMGMMLVSTISPCVCLQVGYCCILSVSQSPSQLVLHPGFKPGFTYWVPNIDNEVVKLLGIHLFQRRPQCTLITTINMYLLDHIKHSVHTQCLGNHIEGKRINYMLEIVSLRNSLLNSLGRCPDALLAQDWMHPSSFSKMISATSRTHMSGYQWGSAY